MPNQRKKSKAYISCWCNRQLKQDLKKIAAVEGISLTELTGNILTAGVERSLRERLPRADR